MPLETLLQDPKFSALSPEAKVIVGIKQLSTEDPQFATLSDEAKSIVIRRKMGIQPATVSAPAPIMPPGVMPPNPTATDIISSPFQTVGRAVKSIPSDVKGIYNLVSPLLTNKISPQDILNAGKNIGSKIFSGPYGTTHGTPEQGKQVSSMMGEKFGTPSKAAGTVNQLGGDILNTFIEHPVSSYLAPKIAGKAISEVTTIGAQAKLKRLDELIAKEEARGLNKGLRPSGRGKKTIPELNKWVKDSGEGVENIVANKNEIMLADEYGNVEAGRVPKTTAQFGEAISQRKRAIYPQFHKILTDAGKVSPLVDNGPIIKELEALAKNEALKLDAPEALEYAKEYAQRLRASNNWSGKMAIEDVEESIAIKNKRLDDYYRTKDFKEGQKAYVDALVANLQRKQVDDIIEGANIAGGSKAKYDELKKTYGSFKGLENEVGRRARTIAGNPPKGVLDFSDIFTTPMAVHGMLTMNPGLVGSGFLAKAIAHYYKWTNASDTIIARMFNKVDKMMEHRRFYQSKVDLIKAKKAAKGGTSPTPPKLPPVIPTAPPTGGITVPGSTFTGAPIPPPPTKMPYTQALIDAQEDPMRRMYPNYWRKP